MSVGDRILLHQHLTVASKQLKRAAELVDLVLRDPKDQIGEFDSLADAQMLADAGLTQIKLARTKRGEE